MTECNAGLVYISVPYSPSSAQVQEENAAEKILRPYLDATLTLTDSTEDTPTKPIFAVFYLQRYGASMPPSHSASSLGDEPSSSTILVTPSLPPDLVHLSDAASTNAEASFWEVANMLKCRNPAGDRDEGGDGNNGSVPDSFWPPILDSEDDEDEQW